MRRARLHWTLGTHFEIAFRLVEARSDTRDEERAQVTTL